MAKMSLFVYVITMIHVFTLSSGRCHESLSVLDFWQVSMRRGLWKIHTPHKINGWFVPTWSSLVVIWRIWVRIQGRTSFLWKHPGYLGFRMFSPSTYMVGLHPWLPGPYTYTCIHICNSWSWPCFNKHVGNQLALLLNMLVALHIIIVRP